MLGIIRNTVLVRRVDNANSFFFFRVAQFMVLQGFLFLNVWKDLKELFLSFNT